MKLIIQAHIRGKKQPAHRRDEKVQELCTKDVAQLRVSGYGPDGVRVKFAVEQVNMGGNYDGQLYLSLAELHALLAAGYEQLQKTDAHVEARLQRLENAANLPPLLKIDMKPKAPQ